MTFSEAVKVVTTGINKDSDKQLVYIANMAYEFETEYWRYFRENKIVQMSRADIHQIAKRASRNFINMWLLNADKEV